MHNGPDVDGVALVFQIVTLDKDRFQRRIGVVDECMPDQIGEGGEREQTTSAILPAGSIPMAEKQQAARRTATASVRPWKCGKLSASPMATTVIPIPKRTEAILSPGTIASTVAGQARSRSKVFAGPVWTEKAEVFTLLDVKRHVAGCSAAAKNFCQI